MLRNHIVLITGASRGIGAAAARLFAKHHAAVAVNYKSSQEAAERVVRDIEAAGGTGFAVQGDVTDPGQVERMVEQVAGALGPIDTLVLNAGLPVHNAAFVNDTWADFERKLSGELQAAFFCAKAVVPSMIERKRGCIIAVSSAVARHASPGLGAHAASKGALESFVRTLAVELGQHGVRANTVAAGLTRTDASKHVPESLHRTLGQMTPLRRTGTPEDVAGAIVLLAMEEARFVTGSSVLVDGGLQQS